MHPLFPLMECCFYEVAPEYFLMQLQNYSEREQVSLKHTAELILPFVNLYNRVLFRSLLGCILQKPELITPAISHFIFRNPFIHAAEQYPDLQLQRALAKPLTRPTQIITRPKIELFQGNAFANMVLAHCGLTPWKDEYTSVLCWLGIPVNELSSTLEEYVATYGLPTNFINEVRFERLGLLSKQHRENIIALLVASKNHHFLNTHYSSVLMSLLPVTEDHQIVFDLLTSKKHFAELALTQYLNHPESLKILYHYNLQLGPAFNYLNQAYRLYESNFKEQHELEQLFFWYFSQVILTQPVKITGLYPPSKQENSLRCLIEHPLIAPRFDSVADLLTRLPELQPTPTCLRASISSVSLQLTTIDVQLALLKKLINQFCLTSIRNALTPKCLFSFLQAILIFMSLNDFTQYALGYFSNSRIISQIFSENETVLLTAFNVGCISCNLFTQTYSLSNVPNAFLEQNNILADLVCCMNGDPTECSIKQCSYDWGSYTSIFDYFNQQLSQQDIGAFVLIIPFYAIAILILIAYLAWIFYQSLVNAACPSMDRMTTLIPKLTDNIKQFLQLTDIVTPNENADLHTASLKIRNVQALMPSPFKKTIFNLRSAVNNVQTLFYQHPMRASPVAIELPVDNPAISASCHNEMQCSVALNGVHHA